MSQDKNFVRVVIPLLLFMLLGHAAVAQPSLQPSIVLEPPNPRAQQPFTITVEYRAFCPFEAEVIVGGTVRITARESDGCPAVPFEPRDTVALPGLAPGIHTVELFRQLVSEPPVGPVLLATFEIEIGPSAAGILDVDVERAGDVWVADVSYPCSILGDLEPQQAIDGLIRVRQFPPIGLPFPCGFDDPPQVTRIALGSLTPGAYALLIEGEREAQGFFDWVEPFTVPSTDDLASVLLQGERFRVDVRWQTARDAGDGFAQLLSGDSAAFWFFRPSNTELLVKVLDGCRSTGHYWLFAAGLTNQGVTLTVEDRMTGDVQSYDNPLGRRFQPILDTRAFACDR